MGTTMDKAKKALMALVGIQYTVEEPEIIPLMPSKDGKHALGELVQELSKYINTKKEIYQKYNELKETNHLAVALLNKVAVDVLHKGRERTQPLFEIKYDKDARMKDILDKVVDNFGIEKHLEEIIFEALLFGEYYLKNDFQNSEFDDRYEYIDVLPVYTRGHLTKAFLTDDGSGKGSYYKDEIDPRELFVISLALPGERIKLKVYDDTGNRYYIKIPSPFIIPQVVQLLVSIALMEKLIPLIQLMKVDKGSMISVGVPAGTPLAQMFEITREYEKQLNNRFKIDPTSSSMDDVLSSFGRYKVIPTIGDRKATMDVRELPAGQDIEMNDFEYLVRTLANRLGVPISYIFKGIDEDNKATLLYYLKITFIRERISEAIKTFLVNYIEYRRDMGDTSLKLDPDELEVVMPAIPGLESLDTVDYADALSATMSNVQRLIADFAAMLSDDSLTDALDKVALIEVLNLRLEPILGKQIFDIQALKDEIKQKELDKQKQDEPEEPEPDDQGSEEPTEEPDHEPEV